MRLIHTIKKKENVRFLNSYSQFLLFHVEHATFGAPQLRAIEFSEITARLRATGVISDRYK